MNFNELQQPNALGAHPEMCQATLQQGGRSNLTLRQV